MAVISFLGRLWILIIASLHFGHPQQVTITRLDGNQRPVCPGQRLSFQCTTVGSAVLIWRSTAYIGSHLVQIGFFDNEPLNTPKTSQAFPDTVAVLTSKGSRVLTSILTVTVTSVNLNPSVTCVNDDHGNETTFSFNVIVPECRSYGIRIRSVNQCGDKGPFSSEILPDTENICPLISFDSPDSLTTDDVPVCTNPPREECDDCSRPSTASVVVIIVAVVIFVAALILLIATVVLIIWCTRKSKKDCNCKGKSSDCCSAKNEVVPVTGSEAPHTDLETVNADNKV